MPFRTIGIAEFKAVPFLIKGYKPALDANGNVNYALAGARAPFFRDSERPNQPIGGAGDYEQRHIIVTNNRYSYVITPSGDNPGAQEIRFVDSVGHHEACYLPYKDKNISSVLFDNSVNRFFTDNLSGCSMFIDAKVGQIAAYHANVKDGVFTPTVEQSKDNAFEREISIAVKKQYHINAMRFYPGPWTTVCSLFKKQYNSQNNAFARFAGMRTRRGPGQQVGGFGTTVAGFRTGAGWQFWYQTWSVLGGATSVIKAECFGACSI